jgi:TPR repeat protein
MSRSVPISVQTTTAFLTVQEASILKLKKTCLSGDETSIRDVIQEVPELLTFHFSNDNDQTALHFAAAGHPRSLDTIIQLLKTKKEGLLKTALMTKDKDEKLPIDLALESKQDDSTLLKLLEAMGPEIANATSARKNFPKKLHDLVKPAAQDGHAWAQTDLAIFYLNAVGVERNPTEAVSWFLKAAEQHHVKAQFLLGMCYSYNSRGEEDDKQAVKWFTQAAEGKRIIQNKSKAVDWYYKAAAQGHAAAQNNLAMLYLHGGEGVEKDEKAAIGWFLKAAEQEQPYSQYTLGACYETGQGVPQNKERAVEWYQKAANNGYSGAQYNVGVFILTGCIKSDRPAQDAVSWFRKAARQGHAGAQANLGACYKEGRGVATDPKKSAQWYKKAAMQGDYSAINSLGICYYTGSGVPQNLKKAVRWFHRAADEGNDVEAQFNLHIAYMLGHGVEQDEKKAHEYCLKAAEQEFARAQVILGSEEEYKGNMAKAMDWYRKAATNGSAEGEKELNRLKKLHPGMMVSLAENMHTLARSVKRKSSVLSSESRYSLNK